ncbi:MAG: ferredoxin [bacterium]
MTPKINQDTCIGCGTCVSLCGEVFELKDDNKSYVIKGVDYSRHEDCIKESIEVCPVQAISEE